jgi:WD40 repeat protein
MVKLLRNRWLHRALFTGLLIALGVGIYQVQPPEPMCVIDVGELALLSFVDGNRLTTAARRHVYFEQPGPNKSAPIIAMDVATGPLQIWDTRTGEEVARSLDSNKELGRMTFSKDERFAAAALSEIGIAPRKDDHPLCSIALIDVASLQVRELRVQDRWRIGLGHFRISPNGKLVVSPGRDKSIRIYDFTTGHVLAERANREVITFADDSVCCREETVAGKVNLEVWDPRANTVVGTLEDVADSFIHQSSDGKYLVFQHGLAGKNGASRWIIWNARTARIDGEYESAGDISLDAILDDTLRLKHSDAEGEHLEIRVMPNGRLLEKLPPGTHYWNSPNGRYSAVLLKGSSQELVMREMPSLKVLWKHTFNGAVPYWFAPDSRTFSVLQKSPREHHAYDCRTGELLARIPLPFSEDGYPSLTLSESARRIILRDGPSQPDKAAFWTSIGEWIPPAKWFNGPRTHTVVVLDCDTCREQYRVNVPSLAGVRLSDDDRTLVTIHESFDPVVPGVLVPGVLRFWDLDASKPLRWPIGVPAGLGALIALLVWWRGRRPKRPARIEPTPCSS